MTLAEYLATYLLEHSLAENTQRSLTYAVRQFERWNGGQVELDKLDSELMNRYLIWLAKDRQPATVRSRRCDLMTLWRSAYSTGIAPHEPSRVRRVKLSQRIPRAWTEDELTRLLAACELVSGYFSETGIKRSLFFSSLFLAMYDTGLRLCDMLRIERDWIDKEGVIALTQIKTSNAHICAVRGTTLEAIDQTFPPQRALCWPLWGRREAFYRQLRQVVRSAGLKGSTTMIRRSSASYLERDHPGAAMAHLGHKTPGLAYRHYVDPRIAYSRRPLPPSIQDL